MGPSLDLSRNGSSGSNDERLKDKENGEAGSGSDSRLATRSDLDPGGHRYNGHRRDSGSESADHAAGSQTSACRSTRRSSSRHPPTLIVPEPPDGGWGWMIVIGSIMTVGIVPTLFVCFGVFMNAFLVVFPNDSKSSASWIPSIMNALMNFMGPITSALVNRYSARWVAFSGGLILSSGLVLSYFTSSVKELYLTYGVLGGIGAGLSLPPGLYLISQYFKRRRGVATGLCMAGGSFCGIVFPILVQNLLNEYNFHGCILILGGITMNICVSAALFRPYDPRSSTAHASRSKRRRRKSSSGSHRRSSPSLSFLTDDAVVSSKRGSFYLSVTEDSLDRKSKAKKKSNKKKRKKTRSRTPSGNSNMSSTISSNMSSSDKNKSPLEVSLLLGPDKSWQSLSPSDAIIVPKARARTLSIDSARTLPDIPEEREDDGVPNGAKNKADQLKGREGSASVPTISVVLVAEEIEEEDHAEKNGTGPASCSPNLIEQPLNCDAAAPEVLFVNGAADVVAASTSTEVVALNHMFGSVASIASLGGDKPKPRTLGMRHGISRAMGFTYFSQGIFYVLSGSFTFMLITMGSFTMLIPTYGVSVNLSHEKSAGLLSITAVASVFGRLILPSLSDYVTLKRKHIYAISSVVASGAVLSAIFVRDYFELVCCLVFFGFSSGGCLAISINVFLDYIRLDQFTSFFGLVGVIVGAGSLFATPLMALLVDTTGSYRTTFACLSASSALSGAILYLDRFTAGKQASRKKPTATPV